MSKSLLKFEAMAHDLTTMYADIIENYYYDTAYRLADEKGDNLPTLAH